MARCGRQAPGLDHVDGHLVACHLYAAGGAPAAASIGR